MRISDWSSDVCSSDLEQDAGDIRPGFEHASDQAFRPAHGLAFVYALAAARVEKAEPPGTRCRRTDDPRHRHRVACPLAQGEQRLAPTVVIGECPRAHQQLAIVRDLLLYPPILAPRAAMIANRIRKQAETPRYRE